MTCDLKYIWYKDPRNGVKYQKWLFIGFVSGGNDKVIHFKTMETDILKISQNAIQRFNETYPDNKIIALDIMKRWKTAENKDTCCTGICDGACVR